MWNLTPTSRHPYPTIRHKRADFFNFNTYAIEKELFKNFSWLELFSKFCKTLSNGSESNSSIQFVGFSVLLQLPNLLNALLLIFIFIVFKIPSDNMSQEDIQKDDLRNSSTESLIKLFT